MLPVILLLAIQTLQAQPDRFGLPACDAPDQLLIIRTAYISCHSTTHKVPLWSIYQLTPEMLATGATPRQHFRRDPNLPSATDADYRNSGFHRSHLVPASDLAANPQALRETYLLTNAVPQLPELNLSAWRTIENDLRKLAAHSEAVIIITGTLFDCAVQHIGPNQIAVPCATYKAALAIRGAARTTYAAILDNQAGATRQTVSVRTLEQRSHLDFFSSIPAAEQDQIEAAVSPLR